ncbi:dihydropteroate synthase [Candidatus Nitronereus thalassa]|uniref:Dihydropteroate synthase n=1 Tax=Candidatus Nitronereus thalassa TaxID=3020898 RepID=A0ABU3KDB5_9BACT|nr:dihydropteroate synthase [Candidatus Nitronereus thalassa]MDT7044248.1 dihydropteroate synthase [Candidatus Nitronereus thalassa]
MAGSVTEVTERWIRAGSKRILLGPRPLIMGVLNITPDSFSDGGRFLDPHQAIDQAQKMVDSGADIIDVGAESTRPGSQCVDVQEELRRLNPVLEVLGKRCSVPLSVDTRKGEVARRALELGVHVINDISALQFSPNMGKVVAEYQAGIVLMHMEGDPATMQDYCHYDNVVDDVKHFLQTRIEMAESYGIDREQIVIDPGIGFAKNTEQNLQLLNGLAAFESLGQPVLVGVSNKSFIGSIVKRPVAERMMGTAAAVATAVFQGAHIIRVHDVEPMRDVVAMVTAIKNAHLN